MLRDLTVFSSFMRNLGSLDNLRFLPRMSVFALQIFCHPISTHSLEDSRERASDLVNDAIPSCQRHTGRSHRSSKKR